MSAFELLQSEGYVQGTVGSGTYVSNILPEALLEVTRATGQAAVNRTEKEAGRFRVRQACEVVPRL